MAPLDDTLRRAFEKAVINARDAAEAAARTALTALALEREVAPAGFGVEQRRLRNALRARARQLGNGDMAAGTPLLVEEIAYEQWHRMLFARFLAENELLMHPAGAPVSLQDCADLALEAGDGDAWQVATGFAARMLPGIFRADAPAAQVRLAPEDLQRLERILAALPAAVFTSDNGLGWAYQFWQAKKKEEVNRSGRKIGGADLAPVTQLFTEDYMVQFLLHNSLGAWWAARHPASPLVKELEYLRFRDDGTPAAGTFPGWPQRAAEVTVIDPCCGSGHFLVAAFELLRRMRMEEEGLSVAEATEAVLRDNLFGLELDARCTQIAAFALALAAWKAAGYRPLPLPNIACSGVPLAGSLEEWTRLAGDDPRLRSALERLYHLFKHAPDLGSLINPADLPPNERMFSADYHEVEPLLERALARERGDDPAAAVFGDAARGVLRAARLLARQYTLVATNVPYLGQKKQEGVIRKHCDMHYPAGRADLAAAFVYRCRAFAATSGTYAAVTPQSWLFLSSYKGMRKQILESQVWHLIARLGPRAFGSISGEVVNTVLVIVSNTIPSDGESLFALDVSDGRNTIAKATELQHREMIYLLQLKQLRNPDTRIVLQEINHSTMLEVYANSYAGILNGDSPKFQRLFWELGSTVDYTQIYGGRVKMIYFDDVNGHLREDATIRRERLHDSDKRGNLAWGKLGVAVSQMGSFPVTLYTGEKFDSNVAVILPKNPVHITAIWAYCQSPEFSSEVKKIDKKMNVTNATFVKIPFDLAYWQRVAEEAGPLPEPYSNDPTQWLFKGLPADSTAPLQVAVAKLLGYRWPAEDQGQAEQMGVKVTAEERRLLRALGELADADGIVCLPAVSGERPAHERLRALLATAYGDGWSVAVQDELLAQVGFAGKSLEAWLRDGFFKQHCELFHNRPFIWHIWDGLRDGFAALVNYHRLDRARLEKLIYTYLGAWIRERRAERDAGLAGAEGKLVAALELQKKLEAILEGEPPYDIYVRWKPLHQQPIGWEPDLNDGVRLNIRPFVTAGVLRSKFTIHWKKDRGSNPDGSERLNDLHLSNEEKRRARAIADSR